MKKFGILLKTAFIHQNGQYAILGIGLLFSVISMGCKKDTDLVTLPSGDEATGPRSITPTPVKITLDTDDIEATGTTTALSTTRIQPVVPGTIQRMPFREGDRVKKGDILVVLDQRGYKLSMRQAQAAYEQAKIALEATTREKNRFEKLLKEDATARAQYDRIRDKFRGAEVAVKQAQVALDMAQKALGDAVLKAPYNGIVVKKMSSVGDYATAMPPTVMLILMDISTLELKISLPEPELQRVEEGQAVTVEFPSLERTEKGKISRLVRSVDPLTQSFTAIVEIPNKDLSLRPGVFARASISISKPRKRLLIPNPAVVDDGDGIYSVFVLNESHAKRREVKIMAASDSMTEVTAGLKGNELIILESNGLEDGDLVKVKNNQSSAASTEKQAQLPQQQTATEVAR